MRSRIGRATNGVERDRARRDEHDPAEEPRLGPAVGHLPAQPVPDREIQEDEPDDVRPDDRRAAEVGREQPRGRDLGGEGGGAGREDDDPSRARPTEAPARPARQRPRRWSRESACQLEADDGAVVLELAARKGLGSRPESPPPAPGPGARVRPRAGDRGAPRRRARRHAEPRPRRPCRGRRPSPAPDRARSDRYSWSGSIPSGSPETPSGTTRPTGSTILAGGCPALPHATSREPTSTSA